MLTILNDHVVICLEAIKNMDERNKLIQELTMGQKVYEIVEISYSEMEGMCANMFNLIDNEGRNSVIMSHRASKAYS